LRFVAFVFGFGCMFVFKMLHYCFHRFEKICCKQMLRAKKNSYMVGHVDEIT
jgi:hypothetical protein